jgi:hypothetical protein
MKHQASSLPPTANSSAPYGGAERRRAPRIEIPFPAIVRGVDVDSQAFEAHTVLDDMSALGLSMRLFYHVAPCARLFVLIDLLQAATGKSPAARIALRATVVRVQSVSGGAFDVAAAITNYRFCRVRSSACEQQAAVGGAMRTNIPP